MATGARLDVSRDTIVGGMPRRGEVAASWKRGPQLSEDREQRRPMLGRHQLERRDVEDVITQYWGETPTPRHRLVITPRQRRRSPQRARQVIRLKNLHRFLRSLHSRPPQIARQYQRAPDYGRLRTEPWGETVATHGVVNANAGGWT
jgi:hypothetical protein